MSEFIRALVGMFAVIAPLGALATLMANWARSGQGKDLDLQMRFGAPAAALVVLATFALASEPLLDWLEISPESFQFAAGAAMFPLALRLGLVGDSMSVPARVPEFAWVVPYAVPILAGPSSIIAAISYAARFGEAEAILASAIVLAVTAILFVCLERMRTIPPVVVQTTARLSGGLLIVIAVELAVDGVRSV